MLAHFTGGQVSDDAQWVAHFDFEGLRQTSFYKEVNEQLLQQYISKAENRNQNVQAALI